MLISGALSVAVLARLRAASSVTALVPAARIVDEPEPRPARPFVVVESAGEVPFNTLGAPDDAAFGSDARIAVRVVSEYRGDAEVQAIASAVRGALDGAVLALGTFPEAMLTWESTGPMLRSMASVLTREQVSEFSVTVHQ